MIIQLGKENSKYRITSFLRQLLEVLKTIYSFTSFSTSKPLKWPFDGFLAKKTAFFGKNMVFFHHLPTKKVWKFQYRISMAMGHLNALLSYEMLL